MNEWAGVFLGVIALTAVVQCVFVIVAAQGLAKTGARVNEFCQNFDVEVKPVLEDLRKGAANLRAISESGREQALRVEGLVTTTLGNLETSIEAARALVMKPIASLTELSAFWGGLRRGIETYRGGEPKGHPPKASSRRSEDSDEHMFIG